MKTSCLLQRKLSRGNLNRSSENWILKEWNFPLVKISSGSNIQTVKAQMGSSLLSLRCFWGKNIFPDDFWFFIWKYKRKLSWTLVELFNGNRCNLVPFIKRRPFLLLFSLLLCMEWDIWFVNAFLGVRLELFPLTVSLTRCPGTASGASRKIWSKSVQRQWFARTDR